MNEELKKVNEKLFKVNLELKQKHECAVRELTMAQASNKKLKQQLESVSFSEKAKICPESVSAEPPVLYLD